MSVLPHISLIGEHAEFLLSRGEPCLALQIAGAGLQSDPQNPELHHLAAIAAARSGKPDLAEAHYRAALQSDPHCSGALVNLGILLADSERICEAETCYRTALEISPEIPEIHANLADLLASKRKFEEAESHYRNALDLGGGKISLSNLGVMLADQGREEEAESCFRKALSIDPHYQLARLNLSFLLLSRERYGEGWLLHEARHHPGLPGNGTFFPKTSAPRWQGEEVSGKSILVWGEQGYGDEIQFCRYVAELARAGAKVTYATKPGLEGLMKTLEGVHRVIVQGSEIGECDCWIHAMSLPLFFEAIPQRIPYLSADPEKTGAWQLQGNLKVGITWQGNPNHRNDRDRSLPSLAILSPLFDIPGIRFFSIQAGKREEMQGVESLGEPIRDFSDTASILANLDLLISVDTANAHLAGALGVPCWLLLPAFRPDWRWLRNREDSPWYPGSMRIFRQEGGWESLVRRLKSELKRLV
ncbi:MAG: tetratricopeptide repeat protein [Burkholderiales bacterium]|nr:tetratricopeptide repeat protein [Burkholderiales bacterium]